MKFFRIVFSLYILLLSGIPCLDAAESKTSSDCVSLQSSPPGEQNHQEDAGCSPFCTCACCGCQGFNVSSYSSLVASPQFISEKYFPEYTFDFSSSFISSVWQPPKLG